MIENISIKAYTSQSLPLICILFERSILEGASNYYSYEQLLAWQRTSFNSEDWEQRLAQQHTLLAWLQSTLVGFASRKGSTLDLLYVHPQYLRKGIARQLYLPLEAAARQEGIVVMETQASRASQPFFEHMGWFTVAAQKVCRGAVDIPNFYMKKVLAT